MHTEPRPTALPACVRVVPIVTAVLLIAALASPASAQRLPFERSFEVGPEPTLDATTVRGKITVTAGAAGRVSIRGTVTIRTGFDLPANALESAQRVAANPPVEHSGNAIRVGEPQEPVERRALTVAYEITVPPGTRVTARSESGAISISGMAAPVSTRTQSGAIALERLGGAVDAASGSAPSR